MATSRRLILLTSLLLLAFCPPFRLPIANGAESGPAPQPRAPAEPREEIVREEAFTVEELGMQTAYPSPPPSTYFPLVPLRPGQPATTGLLEAFHEMLEGTGLFRSVDMYLHPVRDGKSVLFQLTQAERVRKVAIRGNFPVLESAVRRVLEMQEGAPFDPGKLPPEVQRIQELYQKKGWYRNRVSLSESRDPRTGSAELTYKIEKGKAVRLGEIVLEGVERGDPEKIRDLLETRWRLSDERIQKKLAKVEEYYQKLGYPAAAVRHSPLELGTEGNRATLRVSIEEGKKLVLSFTGNEELSEEKLRKATTFDEAGRYGYFDAEDSADGIRDLYQTHGFPFAQVTFKRAETRAEVQVAFSIEEGQERFIEEIDITGNENIKAGKLKDQILTRSRNRLLLRKGTFLTRRWEDDQNALVNFYLLNGFMDVKIDHELVPSRDPDRVTLKVDVREGPRYTTGPLRLIGVRDALAEPLLERLEYREGEPFHQARLLDLQREIATFYARRGYILAHVEPSYQALADHRIEMICKVEEGPLATASGIVLTGNYETRRRSIRKALHTDEGEPINELDLAQARERLYDLGRFSGVSIQTPGVDPEVYETVTGVPPETVERPIVLQVREANALRVELGARYDSDLGIEGLLHLREMNLLGRLKQVNISLLGGQERAEGSAYLTDPTLLGYRTVGSVGGRITQLKLVAFTEDLVTLETVFYRTFRRKYTPSLGVTAERAKVYDVESDAPDAPRSGTSLEIFLEPRFVYDTRDDKLFPTGGFYGQVGAGISNSMWKSDDELVRSRVEFRSYQQVVPNVVFAEGLSLQFVEPYGSSSDVPSSQLLFSGGNNSVRGFPRDKLGPLDRDGNPLGGTTLAVANLELRFPVYRVVHGVVFVDTGSLTRGFPEMGLSSFRWAVGGGLRVYTPIGPLRLEYGYQLQPNPPLDRGEIHFSLGFPF
ncbi:MAG: POTRA domain-containing protein [bacterium]